MARKKKPQKKFQKRKPYQKNQNNQAQALYLNNMGVKIAQMDFWMKRMTRKIDGIAYALDRYLRMKGDSEELNNLIMKEFDERKKQEPKSAKFNRNDSQSSKPK